VPDHVVPLARRLQDGIEILTKLIAGGVERIVAVPFLQKQDLVRVFFCAIDPAPVAAEALHRASILCCRGFHILEIFHFDAHGDEH